MIERMLRMATMLSVTLILTLFVVGQSAMAAERELPGGHVKINEVFVDLDSGEIIITGEDFDFGDTPEVTLGDFGLLEIVGTPTATEIVVSFPDAGLPDGDYLLTVATGSGQSKSDEYDLTVGAVGPEGPQGPPGVAGLLAAHVSANGFIVFGSVGLNAVTILSTGKYLLTFNQDIHRCTRVASLGHELTVLSNPASFDGNPGEIYTFNAAATPGGNADLVVVTYDSAGTKSNRGFNVLLWCGN